MLVDVAGGRVELHTRRLAEYFRQPVARRSDGDVIAHAEILALDDDIHDLARARGHADGDIAGVVMRRDRDAAERVGFVVHLLTEYLLEHELRVAQLDLVAVEIVRVHVAPATAGLSLRQETQADQSDYQQQAVPYHFRHSSSSVYKNT